MKQTTLFATLLFFFLSTQAAPLSASAADLPKLPPSVDAMGKTLVLNGVGLRTATLFKVKVYEAGLYLPRRSSDAQQILQSNEPKVVRLSFLRDVSSKQVQDAWHEGFEKNCESNCEALDASFNQFVSHMSGAKTGDVFVYLFTPKGVNVIQNGKEIAAVSDPRLARVILSTWLGKEPPSQELKQAMLGITPQNVS